MAENSQNFFDFGAMPPMPDFVRVRQNGNTQSQPQKSMEKGQGTPQNRTTPTQNNIVQTPQNAPQKHVQQQQRPNVKSQNSGLDLLRMFNLKGLSMDSDRTLILAVIFLLLGDTSDELLLLALLYIMI